MASPARPPFLRIIPNLPTLLISPFPAVTVKTLFRVCFMPGRMAAPAKEDGPALRGEQ
jgi:hypothetical protein